MNDKESMIYGYVRTQFQMDKINVLLTGENRIRISDEVETLTLTCDDDYNIIECATNSIIAKRTLLGWQNVPGKFWH